MLVLLVTEELNETFEPSSALTSVFIMLSGQCFYSWSHFFCAWSDYQTMNHAQILF